MILGTTPAIEATAFASANVDETRHAVSNALNPHRLICSEGMLDASMHQFKVGSISIIRLKYGASVLIEPDRRDGFYIAQVPTRGRARVLSSGTTLELDANTGAFLSPTAHLAIEWSSNCEQHIVKIPVTTLHRFAEMTLGISPTDLQKLEQPSLLHNSETRSLIGFIEFATLQRPLWDDMRLNEVFSRNAEELLLGCLVLNRLRYQPRYSSESIPGIAPRYVRDAEEYLRSNLHRPITLSNIARSVGISVRTLHKAFRDFRGTTPMATLHSLRLAAVRDELRSAPRGTGVANVARRWGFAHLGRFSVAYRRKYGEHPRQTLCK